MATTVRVLVEQGKRRVFASALEWPGWSRSGRNEDGALEALAEYGPRYGSPLAATGTLFSPPDDVTAFTVVERVAGDATTDFGAPGVMALWPLRYFARRSAWHALDHAWEIEDRLLG